jgi:hypothetical protein
LTGAERTASFMFARRTNRVWGLSAAAWCIAFGALSLYWAAGGTLGVDELAVSLQERADERETGFVALVAATASRSSWAPRAGIRGSVRRSADSSTNTTAPQHEPGF